MQAETLPGGRVYTRASCFSERRSRDKIDYGGNLRCDGICQIGRASCRERV